MTTKLEVHTDIKPDPNSTVPVHVVDGPNGGVQVDPSKITPPGDKPGERPSWLPAKFKTAEEMATSYAELEKKQSSVPAPQTVVTPEAVTAAGIDMSALNKEFAEKGELSAETLKSLNDKGFDQKAVTSYIAGQTAIAEKLTNDLAAVAGGKTQLTATLEWAATNLPAEDVAAYNAAHDSGNVGQLKLALQGIVALYAAANGKEPELINGGELSGAGGVAPFGSNAEIVAAMSDKRYDKDPVYRGKVEQRMYVTSAFGGR